ncbi:MAG TPA: MFS transporter [Candidatus Cybelea sp.]|nr:MFS transporter [Candidatus Cybelea sp.]
MPVPTAATFRANMGNAFGALAYRNYRTYIIGNGISLIGTWAQRIAVGWLAWQLTHSATWLGVVAFADLGPAVVLGPWSGVLADRTERLTIIWITMLSAMAQAVALALLSYAGVIDIWSLFLLTLMLGCANAIAQPARLALVPNLVEREGLSSAVAINSVVFNGARFVGPALAGFVIAHGSVSLAFALNALTYVAFILSLRNLRIVRPESPALSRNVLSDTVAGYRYAAQHPGIGVVLVLMAATTLGLRAFVELLPGIADAIFARGPQGLAWMTASVGIGAMIGGIWVASRPRLDGLTRVVVLTVLLSTVFLFGFIGTTIFWVALPCLFVIGFAQVITGIGAQTLIQNAVDPQMRGRIMSLYGMIFRGGPAIGAVVFGIIGEHLGLRAAIAISACTGIAVYAWAVGRQDVIAKALEREHEAA